MKPTEQEKKRARTLFVQQHGKRVRRSKAMQLLDVPDPAVFRKVVDANPDMVHRLPGEGRSKYLTSVIFDLLPHAAWCATCGEEST